METQLASAHTIYKMFADTSGGALDEPGEELEQRGLRIPVRG